MKKILGSFFLMSMIDNIIPVSIALDISAHFATKSVQNCHRKPQNVPHAQFNYFSQRPRTDLDKRPLPRPKSTTGCKLIPHKYDISKN